MLHICSTVNYYTLKNSILKHTLLKPTMKVNHFLLAPSSLNAILHTFIFQTNLNRFGLAHTKFLIVYSMLHMNFSHKMVLHYMFTEPIKYANSDSSPFNSDESLSDDTSFSDNDQTLSPNNFSPQTSSNTNPPSKIDPPFLFNQFFNLLVPISPVTELVTHLRTNLHHLLLQIIEIPNFIII